MPLCENLTNSLVADPTSLKDRRTSCPHNVFFFIS